MKGKQAEQRKRFVVIRKRTTTQLVSQQSLKQTQTHKTRMLFRLTSHPHRSNNMKSLLVSSKVLSALISFIFFTSKFLMPLHHLQSFRKFRFELYDVQREGRES